MQARTAAQLGTSEAANLLDASRISSPDIRPPLARDTQSPRAGGGGVTPAFGVVAVVALALAAAAVSVLVLPWALTYDPWSWIVWGREVMHLRLSTIDGPSWKPFPVFFTAPFSLAGDAAPALWLIVARAGGLLALAAAYAAARRLMGPLAGAVAAVALALNLDFARTVWLGNSEGLLVAATVLVVERHLAGRPRAAFVAGIIAALLRPEAWPFVFLYGAWLAWRRQAARRLVVGALLGVVFLWLVPELWGSGHLLRAAERARQPVADAATFAPDPAGVVIQRAQAMLFGPVQALALAGVGFALVRRRGARGRATLALALLAALWLGLVTLMTVRGYSGNSRYVMAPVALTCVVAGVGAAASASVFAVLLRRTGAAAALATACAPALIAAGIVPFAVEQAQMLGKQTAVLEYQVRLRHGAETAIAALGGPAAVRSCGPVATEDYSVPMLAWMLDERISDIRLRAQEARVVLRARPGPKSAPDPPVRNARRFSMRRWAGPWRVYSQCVSRD